MINHLTGLLLQEPENGDTSEDWFAALKLNVSKTNNHVHPANANAVQALAANWALSPGGNADSRYRQLVTVPNSKNYDDVMIEFRLSTGTRVNPSVEKNNATTFYVYTNDNSLTYNILFAGV